MHYQHRRRRAAGSDDRLLKEMELGVTLELLRPWEERPDYEDMPYRPPHRPPTTEWEEPSSAMHYLDHLSGACPPHIEDDEEMRSWVAGANRRQRQAEEAKEFEAKEAMRAADAAEKAEQAELARLLASDRIARNVVREDDQETDMVRMTRERMLVLTVLEEAGGSIYDPTGSATSILAEKCGRDAKTRSFGGTLARMEEEGLIVREINGRRTLRIALPESGDNFSELVEALKVLDGRVEENGSDAATLLRDAMQFNGSKRAFRDLLGRADKQGVIYLERTGNRINSIQLASDNGVNPVVELAEQLLDLTDPQRNETTVPTKTSNKTIVPPEEDESTYTYSEITKFRAEPAPDVTAVSSESDLQAIALYLLDEVVARATAPAPDPVLTEEQIKKATASIHADLDKAGKVLTDRMNQLDAAEHRIKELEASLAASEAETKQQRIENTRLAKELSQRPLGPKVSEIVSTDSAARLEQFKKMMTKPPTAK